MTTAPGAAVAGSPYPQWTVSVPGYLVAEVTNSVTKGVAIATAFPDKLVFFTSQASADAWAKTQGHTPITTPIQTVGGAVLNSAGALVATNEPSSTTQNAGTTTPSASKALLTLGVEFAAVGLFAMIGGISDDAAHIIMIIMAGLYILWAISNVKSINSVSNVITNVEGLA